MDEQSAKQKRAGVRQKALEQCTSSVNTADTGTTNAATPQCAPGLYRELVRVHIFAPQWNAERARAARSTSCVRQALAHNARARLHAWRRRRDAAGPSACKSE